MRKIILSTLFIAGLCASAYSISKVVSAGPAQVNIGDAGSFSPESEPFILSMRQSRLHIEVAAEHKNSSISMFDILGNKVFEMPANEAIDYSVVNLKSGLYFIILKGPQGNFTRKFLHKQEG